MKIGIITFHAAFNYGSMLQAYALQTFLEQYGHEVKIINYRSEIQKQMYSKPITFVNAKKIRRSLKLLCLYPFRIRRMYKKWNLFNDFLNTYLHVTKEYNNVEQLNINWPYDLIITGSDQIWNTCAWDYSDVYFGSFVKSIRKISYAASMGPYPERTAPEDIKELLLGYSSVLVREDRTADFLRNNNIARNINVVIDPTLLLPSNEYEKIISEVPLVDGDYIFYYTPGKFSKLYFSIVEKIARDFNLKIVCENETMMYSKFSNICHYISVGPSEFLNLVKNARLVCGGSFHLLAFSLIFHKDFYSINGDKDSRTNNLLAKLNLENRIISLSNPFSYVKEKINNYSEIDGLLEELRKRSADLLLVNL